MRPRIRIAVDPFPNEDELGALWLSAWGGTLGRAYLAEVLPRSLAHLGAYDATRLVGFVNVAWDGGAHAFILDACVRRDYQRRGIATRLIARAAAVARARGAHWLHVDFEPRLLEFYRKCGFRHTEAGLICLCDRP